MRRTERTEMLIGSEGMRKLFAAHVAVFGAGGVGSYVIEALSRAGIGALTVVDGDIVSESNINRQLCALMTTVGRYKSDVMCERVLQINPDAKVRSRTIYFDENTSNQLDFSEFSYVVDAIDTVSSKVLIIRCAKEAGVPVISCMGTGNKLDPTKFRVCDIEKTDTCPLAKVMRRELRKNGIKNVKVVYSSEPPVLCRSAGETISGIRVPASISFVPSSAGLVIAGEVVKDLISQTEDPV